MPRASRIEPRKRRIPRTITVDPEIWEALAVLSRKSTTSRSRIVENLLRSAVEPVLNEKTMIALRLTDDSLAKVDHWRGKEARGPWCRRILKDAIASISNTPIPRNSFVPLTGSTLVDEHGDKWVIIDTYEDSTVDMHKVGANLSEGGILSKVRLHTLLVGPSLAESE